MRRDWLRSRQSVHVFPDVRQADGRVETKEDLKWRGDGRDDRPRDHVIERELERVRFVFRCRRCFFEPQAEIEDDEEGDHFASGIFVFAGMVQTLAQGDENEEGVNRALDEL